MMENNIPFPYVHPLILDLCFVLDEAPSLMPCLFVLCIFDMFYHIWQGLRLWCSFLSISNS